MTLYELLQDGGNFSCELFGEFDSECSFEWDADMKITDEGYEEFKDIMELPVHVLSNGNIQVDTTCGKENFPEDYLDEEVNRFVVSVAGFIPADDYDRWFVY